MRIANNEKRGGMRHANRTTLCSVGSNGRNQSLNATWMPTEKLCMLGESAGFSSKNGNTAASPNKLTFPKPTPIRALSCRGATGKSTSVTVSVVPDFVRFDDIGTICPVERFLYIIAARRQKSHEYNK